MSASTLRPRQILRDIYGTEPFATYCRRRSISFPQVVGFLMTELDYDRWQEALRALPPDQQARVELELTHVQAMASPDAVSLLTEGARGRELPPADTPGDAARALWFLAHHPALFREAALQREIADEHRWRVALAPPGIALRDADRRRAALADSLRDFFRSHEGQGRFCAVESHDLDGSCCFTARVSDRLQLLELFSDDGCLARQPTRPSFTVVFVYRPGDGRILLKTRLRSPGKVLDLVQRFGRTMLDVELGASSLAPAFRLENLKRRFDPLPDGADMEGARVKALYLVYPERLGRRRVKLETLSGDGQFAILDLLRGHGGGEEHLDQLDVVYAELEVRLWDEARRRVCLVRLWPDRSNLNETPLGQRLRMCLRRWGLVHAA